MTPGGAGRDTRGRHAEGPEGVGDKPSPVIRPLCEADLDAILRIERRCFPEPWTRGMFRQELAAEGLSHFFVMMEGDRIVAYGGYWVQVDEAHITNLAVVPERRRRGYGARVVRFLLREAASRGLVAAYLEVRSSNEAAQALYKGFGFERVGLRRRYYAQTGEDAIVMMAALEPFT